MSVGSSSGLMHLSNVTFGGGSSILMEIAGLDPTEYDRLILDRVDFGSVPIHIAFAGGFVPIASDTFDLFDGTNLFDQLSGASIRVPAGWWLDDHTGILQTPEPASLCLLGLGGLALLRRCRKERF